VAGARRGGGARAGAPACMPGCDVMAGLYERL